jgi:hypothetical protein
MNTAGHEYPKIVTVEVTDHWITASFSDGRQISLPLAWSWRLERAMPAQRAKWELAGSSWAHRLRGPGRVPPDPRSGNGRPVGLLI